MGSVTIETRMRREKAVSWRVQQTCNEQSITRGTASVLLWWAQKLEGLWKQR